jgi:hypothetical protein
LVGEKIDKRKDSPKRFVSQTADDFSTVKVSSEEQLKELVHSNAAAHNKLTEKEPAKSLYCKEERSKPAAKVQ